MGILDERPVRAARPRGNGGRVKDRKDIGYRESPLFSIAVAATCGVLETADDLSYRIKIHTYTSGDAGAKARNELSGSIGESVSRVAYEYFPEPREREREREKLDSPGIPVRL